MTAPETIQRLRDIIAGQDRDALMLEVSQAHPADVAEGLSTLEPAEIAGFVEILGPRETLEIFEFIPFDVQSLTLKYLSRPSLAQLMNIMSPDDRADLMEEVDDDFQERLLSLLLKHERQNVLKLINYPEDSAGAHMTTDYAILRPDSDVQTALEQVRLQAATKETIYYIYVVDAARHLVGLVSLRDLIVSRRKSRVEDIMSKQVISVRADEDIEDVATLSSRYDFLAVPVVDAQERMLGIITFDDLYDIMADEATEDMYHLANLDTDEKVGSPLLRSVKLRVPWLLTALGSGLVAAYTVSLFAKTIHEVVALASLMTIVALLGGNAGNQSLVVVVRALALGEIKVAHDWRVLLKEAAVGLCNGLIVGLVIGAIAALWFGNPWLGLIMWLAIAGNLVIAGLFGSMVPILLRKLNLDPALGSSIFVTTATDVGGFLLFLGLATLVLPHLMGN
ncbi:MAG: magnesium transporter [Desulfarculaceae bacterium]|nr:magnesium transporter [Desulfarculaceae bacterium]MCF8071621.1 magnesium transporter [Desulfarculaceae bacterium]MCF8103182.1 magnesium transporter [Desulfarculaceae bacterium]MCF8114900.1 magnesium transporter [Desulfarculaceae bacterium]